MDEQAEALQTLYDAARRFSLEWELDPWAATGPLSVPLCEAASALLQTAREAERVVGRATQPL